MKNVCKGLSAVDTIKKYVVTDNEIIVTSLTDVDYSVSLADEHILIKTMLEQAKKRNENIDFKELKKNLKSIISRMIIEIGIISTDVAIAFTSIDKDETSSVLTLFELAVVAATILLTMDIKNFIEENKEYEELEKYRIFLNIREDLEQLKNVIIKSGLKKISIDDININTIDNYSLRDIKRIKKILKK